LAKLPVPIVVKSIGERLQLDVTYLTNYPVSGFQYLLVSIDCHSKFVRAFALKNRDAQSVIEKIRPVLREHPWQYLQTDNGGEFVNKAMQELCEELGIKHITITPHSPNENGQVEKSNDSLKSHLVVVCKSHGDNELKAWPSHLEEAVFVYNTTLHSTINVIVTLYLFFCRRNLLQWRKDTNTYQNQLTARTFFN
jgi:transposase InsO family protein